MLHQCAVIEEKGDVPVQSVSQYCDTMLHGAITYLWGLDGGRRQC